MVELRGWAERCEDGRVSAAVLRVVAIDDGETVHNAFSTGLPRGRAIKLHYYPETDSLYIELKDGPGVETREIVEGLAVDLDEKGDVVGFDIDHASGKLDLSKIEIIALPAATAAE